MAEEYDYLFKCIIIGDKGVGTTTLVKYLTEIEEQQTLEANKKWVEATKKQYDKKIDEYRILRDKATGASKRVLIKWIKSLIKQKAALEKWFLIEKPISHRLTTGVEICTKFVKLRGNNSKLQIWVLSPLERFNSIREYYVRDSLCAIIMYDITNINTLNRISEWCQLIREAIKKQYDKKINEYHILKDKATGASKRVLIKWNKALIRGNYGDIPILLVGNKLDLEDLREISIDQANKIIEDLQLSAFMEISSKTGENVELMFERFTQLIINFFENRN